MRIKRMSRRRTAAVAPLAALLGALAVLTVPSPATAAESTCTVRGSTTLASSGEVRLYRVGTRYYTCAYANGRRESLNRLVGAKRFRSLGDMVVSGRYVAFTRGLDGPDHRVESLYVRDARKGRWLHEGVVPVVDEPGFELGDGVEIDSLVMDRRGRAAWTLTYAYEPGGKLRHQVVTLTRTAHKTLLDSDAAGSATGIDSTSLTLSERWDRSRAFWMHGDAPRTATVS